jgi:hypothetical protein
MADNAYGHGETHEAKQAGMVLKWIVLQAARSTHATDLAHLGFAKQNLWNSPNQRSCEWSPIPQTNETM